MDYGILIRMPLDLKMFFKVIYDIYIISWLMDWLWIIVNYRCDVFSYITYIRYITRSIFKISQATLLYIFLSK